LLFFEERHATKSPQADCGAFSNDDHGPTIRQRKKKSEAAQKRRMFTFSARIQQKLEKKPCCTVLLNFAFSS
jgi:hypothetical protein